MSRWSSCCLTGRRYARSVLVQRLQLSHRRLLKPFVLYTGALPERYRESDTCGDLLVLIGRIGGRVVTEVTADVTHILAWDVTEDVVTAWAKLRQLSFVTRVWSVECLVSPDWVQACADVSDVSKMMAQPADRRILDRPMPRARK